MILVALAFPVGVHAKSHLWDMLRVFSNAQGNVQFINMFVSDPAGTGEHFFQGQPLASDTNTYIFPNNLPTEVSTFETWVLIATQDYADLPGASTPDFIIPPNFFDPAGDELRYRNTIDIFTIDPGELPTDGARMLQRDGSTPVNVGINFAGDEGSVTATAAVPSLGTWSAGVAALLMVLLGGVVLLARPRSVRV